MFIEARGWVAAASGGLVALPQVLHLIRSRSAAGVSLVAWQANLGVATAWTGHGLLTGYANLVVPNVLFLAFSTAVLLQLGRARRVEPALLLLPGLAFGVGAVAVDVLAGPMVFAVLAFLPAALAQLAQLRALVVSVGIAGVSLGFLAFNTLNQALWLGWAVSVGEPSVTLVAGLHGALISVSLVLALMRRAGLVRARLSSMWA